jgi:hypothetical protein
VRCRDDPHLLQVDGCIAGAGTDHLAGYPLHLQPPAADDPQAERAAGPPQEPSARIARRDQTDPPLRPGGLRAGSLPRRTGDLPIQQVPAIHGERGDRSRLLDSDDGHVRRDRSPARSCWTRPRPRGSRSCRRSSWCCSA